MNRYGLIALIAAGALVAACSTASQPDAPTGPTGTLVAAFGFDGPQHDVAFMGYAIYAGDVDCADPGDAEPVAGATVPMEAEFLPPWLEADGSGGDMHPFADALFVLQPGLYTTCATPLTDALEPTEHCAPVSGTATVMPEMTVEIVLYSQCLGDPTGALDVVVALNDPPHIENLVLDPSKFVTVCEELAITVTASDPNGDALTYAWSAVGPGGLGVSFLEDGPVLTLVPPAPGPWTFTVVVTDGHGGAAQLSFPVHVTDDDCGQPDLCGDGDCNGSEDCQTCELDCGPCVPQPICGDLFCDADFGEDCQTCELDCGPCVPQPICGDLFCDADFGEDCQTCEVDCGPCVPQPICGDLFCDADFGEDCQTCEVDCGPCQQGCVEGPINDPALMDSPIVTSFDEFPPFSNTPFIAGGIDFPDTLPAVLVPLLPPGFPTMFLGGFVTPANAIPGMDGDPFLASSGSPVVMEPLGNPTSFGFAWGDQNFGPQTAFTGRFFLSDGNIVEIIELQPPDFGFMGLNTCDSGLTIDWVIVGGPAELQGLPVQSADFGIDDIHCDDCIGLP